MKPHQVPGVKHILAISSGKGGVGKSSLTFHLAAALTFYGRIGILDADIYGPSIPLLSGTTHQSPLVSENQRLQPLRQWGLTLLSLGHLIPPDRAVIWRGPMLFKALDQLLFQVDWGSLDVLLIDTPPGTGDVPLTLVQKEAISATVLVTTPQDVAFSDVKKAYDMWKQLDVPILGLIENMAYYLTPEGQSWPLFPRSGIETFLNQQGLPLLGSLPFSPSFAKTCELGIPITQTQDPLKPYFEALGHRVAQELQLI